MFSIKQLIAGIVLILVLGIGALIYRNTLERPAAGSGAEAVACTMEAKLCPDGTSVGRQGPNCEFAACKSPNVELADAGIAFALPEGYSQGVQEPGADGYIEGMVDFYQKPSLSPSVHHYITIYRYPIPEGKTANDVMTLNTRFQPSDMPAESIDEFDTVSIGSKTFYSVTTERFEAQVASSYFLPRAKDVLRFDVIERDVTDWMEPALSIKNLPEHAALREMLGTLQVTE